jgi:hypothetical protein
MKVAVFLALACILASAYGVSRTTFGDVDDDDDDDDVDNDERR